MRKSGWLGAVIAVFAFAGCASSATDAAPPTSRSCAGLPYSCAYLAHLGTTYPYAKEPGSYLFVNGVAYPYRDLSGGLTQDATVTVAPGQIGKARDVLTQLDAQSAAGEKRTPVIAYGSNAAVSALTRKFVNAPNYQGSAVVPVTRVTLQDLDIAWSPHFVFNGAMPATVTNSAGAQPSVWITWLDDAQLQRMHDSESVGNFYAYGTLDRKQLASSEVALAVDPTIYVDCYGSLIGEDRRVVAVADVPARGRTLPAATSLEAVAGVRSVVNYSGSAFDLIVDNVKNPQTAQARTDQIETKAEQQAVRGFTPAIACDADPQEPR